MMRWVILLVLLLAGKAFTFGQNRAGKDRALLFAVNDYAAMPGLKNPVQNARDIAAELERRYGFEAEVVPNPSFAQMEAKIREYQRAYRSGKYPSDGQLFLFFSGHGSMRGKNGYFMPADADPERPFATAMEYDYWRSEIDEIDCRHILVAVDACHSITFDPNWEKKPDRKFARPGEQYADQTLLNHGQYRARLFFTSDATGNQTPDRSTFARQLLEGLRTHQASSGYLTSSELFASYMLKAAPTPGGGDFGSDEPGSCFLFFQKGSGMDPEEERIWQMAVEMNTKEGYGFYLQRYPDGKYKADALDRRKQLEGSGAPPVATIRPPDNMVFIQGGSFEMGDSFEKPVHTVTVSDFEIGRYEVTNEEFVAFLNAISGQITLDENGDEVSFLGNVIFDNFCESPKGGCSGFKEMIDYSGGKRSGGRFSVVSGYGKHPVVLVSWYGAVAYCNWLSEQHGYQKVYTISGNTITANWNANGYRLPTEAEWEFVARSRGKKEKWAGTSTESSLASYANYSEGGSKDGYENTAPVGSLRANSAGLHDMSGNVWEWCWDWYDGGYYEKSKNSRDPRGPDSGSNRVYRGGSWVNTPAVARCANRYDYTPDYRGNNLGFRLARAVR